jgi:hypothetical protein
VRIKDIVRKLKRKSARNITQIESRLKYHNLSLNDIKCNITDFEGTKKRTTFLCSNGDGFISNKKRVDVKFVEKTVGEVNYTKIKLLNGLIKHIKDNSIIPIIVLEAIRYNINYKYDLNLFKNKINATVIDNTNFKHKNTGVWSDRSHMNFEGRGLYSSHLIYQLNS